MSTRIAGFEKRDIQKITVADVSKSEWQTGAFDQYGTQIVIDRYFIEIGPVNLELTEYKEDDWPYLIEAIKNVVLKPPI